MCGKSGCAKGLSGLHPFCNPMASKETLPLLGNLRKKTRNRYVLVIHGGLYPEQQAKYRTALAEALRSGYEVLSDGGNAMDAVVAAVAVMEDNPLFNAAKGAVFNVDGKIELETSLMLSKPPSSNPEIPLTRRGLGITLLTRAKNPSHLVRSLYLSPSLAPHTFLSGNTAEALGESLGETLVDPSYFFTEHRWKEHRRGLGLPEDPLPCLDCCAEAPSLPLDQLPTGTVGAVALDVEGCIAALTSTGGRTNKLVGRIGDTPLMGAGFWAEEWKQTGWLSKVWSKLTNRHRAVKSIGISGTGDGDYFIRQATAVTIARRVRYLHETLDKAAKHAVKDLQDAGGIGGVIGLDGTGCVTMPLNCPGMYRGVIREDGIPKTAIFDDEEVA
ncbi:asparaginase [Crassisporium funariophilum]|nr:asparaginase [Crassisporium funariophilum]